MPYYDDVDDISLPGEGVGTGEGVPGTSGEGQGTQTAVIYAPIIIHGVRTDEPEFAYFLLEWGPDDDNTDNVVKVAIPGDKLPGDDEWLSFPYVIENAVKGDWYKFRISVINNYGWKSATLPIQEGWVYQRAGLDEDDITRLDETTNQLPNSDFEFDTLEDGSEELPYWEYWDGDSWESCIKDVGPIGKGSFGRLTSYNLILEPDGYIRSIPITIYTNRPYALSGYFIQGYAGRAELTFRLAYYDSGDNFLDHDYVLMGEDSIRSVNTASWPGGPVFQARDRVGSIMFPPDNASYARIQIYNGGTSDIWADDLMLTQTNRITEYESWDRESIESYEQTWQYRRNIPPDGTVGFSGITPIQAYSNEDASIDIKLRWTWAEGDRYASGFAILGNLASSGIAAPVPSLADHDFAYKIANAASRKFDLVGVNPVNRYSFAIVPYATVRGGIAYADVSYYDSGSNDPNDPDDVDWVDFHSGIAVNLGGAPRTQVNVVSENDSEIVLEFIVSNVTGESTTTYYRLNQATGSFSTVPEVGGTPQLTVYKTSRDVIVYYYSEGDSTGNKESVLEFVIDINRYPEIIDTRSEYDSSTQQGIVYWYADDDTERVDWSLDSGPTYIVSGQSGNTGNFSVAPGQTRRVDLTPRGRGEIGQTVTAALTRPPERPRIELNVTERTSTTITVEYEVEGFGDDTVYAYSRVGDTGSFSQVSGTPPTQIINRNTADINLYYFASGTTTGLTTNVYTFTIDVDRTAEIISSDVEYAQAAGEYVVHWWADDDTDLVKYKVNNGILYVVSGQSGSTSTQSLGPGETDTVRLTPWGPTGSGTTVFLYPSFAFGALGGVPPYIVVSGINEGIDGGGTYVVISVFSYNASGQLAGVIEYAEGNAVWSSAGTYQYQHKIYRPGISDTFGRYRAHIGNLYSDTVVITVDRDDLPEVRPNIGLSSDQETVRIEWDGDDDVGSVVITPSGSSARTYNQQAGVDEVTPIDYGQTKSFTLQPFGYSGGSGKAGEVWPLKITRPAVSAPWISISKYSENNSSIPATITLKFDAELNATGLYYTTSNDKKPGDAGWTSISNGATAPFNRPEGDISLVVRAYAANGSLYSPVVSFTIDPDEIPSITSAYYDPDWPNDQAVLYWSVDDDTDYVQLYLDGTADGSPIPVSTTNTTITGMTRGVVKTYTIVPMRDSTEFPANAKTVVIAREGIPAPTVEAKPTESGGYGNVTLVINDPGDTVNATAFDPAPAGLGHNPGDPTGWDEYDTTSPYQTTHSVGVLISEKHNAAMFWGVRYQLDDGAGDKWITGAHTFDTDTIPEFTASLTLDGPQPKLSWIGDSDLQSIRYNVSSGSMPPNMTGSTYANNRTGLVSCGPQLNDGITAYVRVRGYGSTGGTGTESTEDWTGQIKYNAPGTGVNDDLPPLGVVVGYHFQPFLAAGVTHIVILDIQVGADVLSLNIENVDGSYNYNVDFSADGEHVLRDSGGSTYLYFNIDTDSDPIPVWVRPYDATGGSGGGGNYGERRRVFIMAPDEAGVGQGYITQTGTKKAGQLTELSPAFDIEDATSYNPLLRLAAAYNLGSIASTTTPDYDDGPVQYCSLSGSQTINSPSNVPAGASFHLYVDVGSGETLTLGSGWNHPYSSNDIVGPVKVGLSYMNFGGGALSGLLIV